MKTEIADWETRSLGRLTSLIKDGSHGTHEDVADGVPLLSAKDVLDGSLDLPDNCRRISIKDYQTIHRSYKFQSDDILITLVGSIGRCCILSGTEPRFTIQRSVGVVRADGITAKYLFHFFRSHRFQNALQELTNASAQGGVYLGSLGTTSIDFPKSPCEQAKIAEVLSTVDRAIEQTEALIAKQERIKTGLMQDLLTRGIDEHGNLRSESTHEFKDSPLGRIPVEWDVYPIGEFGSKNRSWLRSGPFGSDLNTKHWVTEGVPVLTIGSLGEGEIIQGELLFVSDSKAEALKSFCVMPGDIIFSRVADIGRSVVIREHQEGWIISSNLMRISLDTRYANPEFLYVNIAFNSAIKAQLRALSNSGGRQIVNGPILGSLLFPWPDTEEQGRIASRLEATESARRVLLDQLKNQRLLKTALMQDLLTGKRRVTPLLEFEDAH